MLAIGNNEKCPFCDLIQRDFKIDGKDSTEHLMEKHKEQFFKRLDGDNFFEQ